MGYRVGILHRRLTAILAALLAHALTPLAASAQAPPGVFSEVPNAIGPRASPALEPATIRSRVVQIDMQRITAARRGREALKLNLFDDAAIDVEIRRVRPTRTGYFISGRPKGMDWGDVRLVVNGPVMVGTVETPEGKFTIRSAGSSRHVIRQIDPSREPFECEVHEASTVGSPGSAQLPAISSIEPPVGGGLSTRPVHAGDMPTEDGSEVRILVVYTPALRREQGGAAGMQALLDLMIETANQAFEDSGINPRLVLAHSAMVDYVAQGTRTDLNRLQVGDDGYMDEVHALRNEYAADLVHLLTNVSVGGPVGSARPLGRELLIDESSAAFAMTANASEETFTHEVGHNFGMAHDRYWADDPSVQIYPYAFGYVNKTAFESGAPASAWWSTIMATWRRCLDAGISCPRLFRFSNPDQTYKGDPLGVPADSTVSGPDGPADGRRTINNTARWVGSFRSEACTEFLVTPQRPVASVDGGEIALKVDTAPGCLWEASSQSGFLNPNADLRSAGSGFVSISVEANETGAERTGMLMVAGKAVAVRQLAMDAGICGRTPAVMRAIARAGGVDAGNCDQVTDQQLAEVGQLYLNREGVTLLKAGDFEGLTSLKLLNLESNQLRELPAGIFDGLSDLETLSLRDNRLAKLPRGLFSGFSKLKSLWLDDNMLAELPEGLFAGLGNLEDLGLGNNQLATLPNDIFGGLSRLQVLRLDQNELVRLPAGVFADLSELENLELLFNQLTELPGGLFEGSPGLKRLNLLSNRITGLSAESFAGLSELEQLDLYGNELTELPPDAFSDLVNLKGLRLGWNPFATLSKGVFSNLSNLVELSFFNGEMTLLPAGAFAGLSRLESLDFSSNELSMLPSELLKDLPSLKSLMLPYNEFTEVPSQFAQGSWRLERLSLRGNRIRNLSAGAFAGLPALVSLELTSNSLEILPAGAFSGLDSLQALFLDNNSLKSLPDGIFSGLANLKSLDARTNLVDPLQLSISLEKVADARFRAIVPSGAPFRLELPIEVSSAGSGEASFLAVSTGAVESEPLTVSRVEGQEGAVNVDLGALPGPPANHQGYAFFRDESLPLWILESLNPADAALIGLSLSHGTLSPPFSTDAISYEASVARSVSTVTVTAQPANENASLGFFDLNDVVLADADTASAGQQLRLSLGRNTFKIIVTSEDGTVTATYTVVIIRESGICTRTPEVTQAIMTALQDVETCSDVTTADLLRVSELGLRGKDISALKSGDFAGLNSLIRLDLSTNELERLPNDIFSGLSALRVLFLYDNELASLPEDIFSGLSSLRDLWLNGNQLTLLPDGVFSGLSALQGLLLQYNRLNGLPSNVVGEVSGLRTLWLGGNQLTGLASGIFDGSPALERLDMNSNELADLPVDIFAGLSELLELNLVGNQFTSLPADIFSGLSSLRDLWLDDNQLTGLPDGVFSGLTRLQRLSLRQRSGMLSIPLSLANAGDSQFKAIAPTGSPFTMEIRVSASSAGSLDGGVQALELFAGTLESEPLGVSRVTGTTEAVEVDIDSVPELPEEHSGYELRRTEALPLEIPFPRLSGALSLVTGIEVTAGLKQLEVSWDAVSDADGYKVQWKSGDEEYGEERQAVIVGGETATHTITKLAAGAEYTVRLIATKQNAEYGPPSTEVTGVPRAEPPAQVTGVAIAVGGVESLDVSWDAVSDADGYWVQWKSGADDYSESRQALLTGGDAIGYTIVGLAAGTEYTVRVVATREHADDGEPSEEVTGIPKVQPPARVTGVGVEPGVEELAVSWDAVSNADGYKVQWKSGSEGYDEERQVVLLGGETTSYTIIDLSADTAYTIRVIATRENADDGEPSEAVTAMPLSADPDVNADGKLDGDDALIMYHSYAAADRLGDGETGGTAQSRQSLLAGYSGKENPSDEDLKEMIRKANAWREVGVDAGGDINEDGELNESDASVMHYAYVFENLVGNGETGGTARFRSLLLASLAGKANPTDEDLKAMLRRANKLREDFG